MNLPDDYFQDTDDEMLAYLENQAKLTMEVVQKSNETNLEKAYRLLNYLIAGISAMTILLLNNADEFPLFAIMPSLVLIIGWGITAFWLIRAVALSSKKQLSTNIPQNLYSGSFKTPQDKNKLGILKRYELHHQNQAIIDLLKLNEKYRNHTDKAIKFAIMIPVLTAIFFEIGLFLGITLSVLSPINTGSVFW